MMSRIVLCADSETMRQPALLGLSGENLAAQDWLALFTSAEEARGFLRNDDAIDEVWVASSDDVDPISLAAAVKRDRRERGVYPIRPSCNVIRRRSVVAACGRPP